MPAASAKCEEEKRSRPKRGAAPFCKIVNPTYGYSHRSDFHVMCWGYPRLPLTRELSAKLTEGEIFDSQMNWT